MNGVTTRTAPVPAGESKRTTLKQGEEHQRFLHENKGYKKDKHGFKEEKEGFKGKTLTSKQLPASIPTAEV